MRNIMSRILDRSSIMRYAFYLVIITIAVTGVSFARYATTGTRGDVARVAKFDVRVTGSPMSGGTSDVSAHAPGGNVPYTFTVTNHSEVAVRAQLFAQSTNGGTAPSISTSAPFDLAPGGSRNVTVTVTGSTTGNVVRTYVEYAQIN